MPSIARFSSLLPLVSLAAACASHDNHFAAVESVLGKRQTMTIRNVTETDWAYEASFDWGRVNETYELCQTGTQQSPIALGLNQGLSQHHAPNFDGYKGEWEGNFYNWGYGPAFTLLHPQGNFTTLPSMKFDNETVYLRGWHIHSPADHSVGGDRSKAELHYVHVDAKGHERAVLAIRLDPGNGNSTFFSQLPPMISYRERQTQQALTLNMELALQNVNYFNEFWTYRGSLTSPPCHEGIRWFVARTILFTSVDQMQDILRASTYSARAEQEVWLHEINV